MLLFLFVVVCLFSLLLWQKAQDDMTFLSIVFGILAGIMAGGLIGFLLAFAIIKLFPGLVRKLAGRGGGWISLRISLTKALICLVLIVVAAIIGGTFGAFGIKY